MIIKYNPELIPGIDYNFIVHTVVPATMQDDLIIFILGSDGTIKYQFITYNTYEYYCVIPEQFDSNKKYDVNTFSDTIYKINIPNNLTADDLLIDKATGEIGIIKEHPDAKNVRNKK
jgi:hypothetical protein